MLRKIIVRGRGGGRITGRVGARGAGGREGQGGDERGGWGREARVGVRGQTASTILSPMLTSTDLPMAGM